MFPWQLRWVPEDWSECSKTCGGGKQVRKITCRKHVTRTKDRRIGKRHCKQLPKPAKRRHCNTQRCPPDWHTGRWSKVCVCLSVCMSVWRSSGLAHWPLVQGVSLSVCLSVCLSGCPPDWHTGRWSKVCLCLSLCLSVCIGVPRTGTLAAGPRCVSVCPSVCLSVLVSPGLAHRPLVQGVSLSVRLSVSLYGCPCMSAHACLSLCERGCMCVFIMWHQSDEESVTQCSVSVLQCDSNAVFSFCVTV